ncbi:MAG: peptidoglycan-binding domain-containing protein, partial [Pseudomonadota bacterium]
GSPDVPPKVPGPLAMSRLLSYPGLEIEFCPDTMLVSALTVSPAPDQPDTIPEDQGPVPTPDELIALSLPPASIATSTLPVSESERFSVDALAAPAPDRKAPRPLDLDGVAIGSAGNQSILGIPSSYDRRRSAEIVNGDAGIQDRTVEDVTPALTIARQTIAPARSPQPVQPTASANRHDPAPATRGLLAMIEPAQPTGSQPAPAPPAVPETGATADAGAPATAAPARPEPAQGRAVEGKPTVVAESREQRRGGQSRQERLSQQGLGARRTPRELLAFNGNAFEIGDVISLTGVRRTVTPVERTASDQARAPASPPPVDSAKGIAPSVEQNLSRRDRMRVQRRLTLIGMGTGGVDGIFGPATRSALEAFQTAAGLPANGQLDPETMAALLAKSDDRYRKWRKARAAARNRARKLAASKTRPIRTSIVPAMRNSPQCARDARGVIISNQSFSCDVDILTESLDALFDG